MGRGGAYRQEAEPSGSGERNVVLSEDAKTSAELGKEVGGVSVQKGLGAHVQAHGHEGAEDNVATDGGGYLWV